SEFTGKLRKIDGFFPLYYDEDKDKMFIEVERLNEEFLYLVSLPTGVGSNPIGLDRGQLGSTKVVSFERVGDKILMVQPNYDYRALSDNAAEKRAVEESFARSVIWGFKIVAKESGKYLVDATDFFLRDAHGVSARLNQLKQGNYNFDPSRSAFYMPRTKGFPKNVEVEATITLTSKSDTGRMINQTAPSGDAVTVRQRHSLVELPDNNYKPREFDPRIGAFAISFYDYATDIGENLEKRWVVRHRLHKKNPAEKFGEAVEPIIYYVDNGTPKKIQDALIEGASWWNQAFEAAGFKNAFQVKVLPAGADPMDIRYNVINWVHRSTRGWAYGSSVVDPRTGEIIKGVVTLDSQRARQDHLIGSAFAPQYGNAAYAACDFALMPDVDYLTNADSKADADAMSVARIRQLSAHEVGHTLGFAHNFAASTYGRGSVMDYPAPIIEIKDGKLDFSNAYAVGIGTYDKWVTQFAYTDIPPGADEKAELEKIIDAGIRNGYLYISDGDTRPASAAHPLASLWDNGSDPIAELAHVLKIRQIGLNSFGLKNIGEGEPLSELENKLLPLYLHHRYQTTAAIKSIGGVYYSYSVRTNDGASPDRISEIVPAARQREALSAVLKTIAPEELAIPEKILSIIPPMAAGTGSSRSELFAKRTRPVFDPIGAAEIAADMTVSGLLEPNRAARMITFNSRNSSYPHFSEVVAALINAAWKTPVSGSAYRAEIQRTVENVIAQDLMRLASNESALPQVAAAANDGLRQIAEILKTRENGRSGNAFDRLLIEN
ncbi:MAG: zinc-dependent metalloprotease, partial [Acidobacteria bacterium]|nr:zinc-dependent metalloprotease [Acidobacteriota bacterium]